MRSVGKLTPFERDVMRMLCEGHSPTEIGKALGHSRRNIHNHLSFARVKLGARTNWEACAVFGAIHRERVLKSGIGIPIIKAAL